MAGPLGIGAARDGSGTSWLPDLTPMAAIHGQAGDWALMLHGNAFAQYINETGARGDRQAGSIHWIMGMARRQVAGGPLSFRLMLSAEPFTVQRCGYPALLATGEQCEGAAIHDRQHPHDFLMEVAAVYQRPITKSLAIQLYGGLAAEPALGPVAFPHRASAMPNPIAPIAHHWLDSTHISFGVVTAGVYQRRWKLEGSLFNGREPDEDRWDLDLDRMDSYSGRLWLLPNDRWSLQVSAGRLEDAEAHHGDRIDVARVTASATYHRQVRGEGFAATTVAWGRNSEGGRATQAMVAETAVSVDARNTVFARAEVAQKSGEELVLTNRHGDTFTIGKIQAGYARSFSLFRPRLGPLVPGVGASASLGIVPSALRAYYGRRANPGFTVFLSLRPAAATPVTLAP